MKSGVGVTLTRDESGYIRIAEIFEDSPAAESGLLENDIITAVDGTDIKELDFDEAISRMRGIEGSEITLTVRRSGERKKRVKAFFK